MSDLDLLFQDSPLSQPADLVFGSEGGGADTIVSLNVILPAITVTGQVHPRRTVTLAASFPAMQVVAEARYDSNTQRPTVGSVSTQYQAADSITGGIQDFAQAMNKQPVGARSSWAAARGLQTRTMSAMTYRYLRERVSLSDLYRPAVQLRAGGESSYSNMLNDRRPVLSSSYSEAVRLSARQNTDYQERLRHRASLGSAYQEALSVRVIVIGRYQTGLAQLIGWASKYQEGIVPPPGVHDIVIPPQPGDPCYTPPDGDHVDLVYSKAWSTDLDLVFRCERHDTSGTVVVPVQRVYIVINDASLKRVEDNAPIHAYTMSLSLDVDSWTWGFSATVPAEQYDALAPASDGTPVELEASINGETFRVVAEQLSRERTFGKSAIRIQGRGKSALLSQPYAPVLNFNNPIDRTANQIAEDILTFNGVPIGWDVDWQIDDWIIPAGVWSARGSYIDALNVVAAAAGGYVQPHATAQSVLILARYPSAPWEWDTVTPDFELPAAVTTREGVEWLFKPSYNRVYVSGTSDGVLGRVTRAGTAGDLPAPMITDPLITQAPVARQRGLSILADTGRQAKLTLRLPVLASTGIITPGKFVRYVDGVESRLGIVRSTSVDVTGNANVWQQLIVESHL